MKGLHISAVSKAHRPQPAPTTELQGQLPSRAVLEMALSFSSTWRFGLWECTCSVGGDGVSYPPGMEVSSPVPQGRAMPVSLWGQESSPHSCCCFQHTHALVRRRNDTLRACPEPEACEHVLRVGYRTEGSFPCKLLQPLDASLTAMASAVGSEGRNAT